MLAITFEFGISLALTVMALVVVPSVAWLIKEVLALRNDMIKQQTEIANIKETCTRHQEWQSAQQKTLNRIDNNVVRICAKVEVDYDAE